MKNLVKKFLSEEDRKKITRCVKEVEKTTSGEIVPMVVPASYPYPMANMIGGLSFGLAVAVVVTIIVGLQRAWGGLTFFHLWLFPLVFLGSFIVFHELVKRVTFLKRLFVSRSEMNEEVQEEALNSFYRKELNRTRDQTGILLFISVFERKAWVLADQGINEKVDPTVWQEVVDMIVSGIKEGRQGEAICRAVRRCGELIKDHFPIKPDDRDELDNLIVED